MCWNQNHVGSFPSLFFRAHWFLVVVCFPALEDVQYESFPGLTGETFLHSWSF